MRGIRQLKKNRTRKAIMDAAVRLFSEKGFEETSIEQLAKTAGIGKGTIYSYFQTKTDIFRSFCEDELDYIYGELLEKADPDSSLIEQLMILYVGEFRAISRNKKFGRLFMQQIIFPVQSEHVKTRRAEDRRLELVLTIYKRAQERDQLRKDIDLLYVAGHFYGLFIMVISSWYSGKIHLEKVEQRLRMFFQQALDGLAPSVGN